MASINTIIAQIKQLPALPGTVAQFASMVSSQNYDPDKIKDIVRNDEALSLAILRAGNSALYGAVGKMFDLRESIVRLGARNLLRIAMDHQINTMFEHAGRSFGLRRGDMWRGAVGGALAAEMLAKDACPADADLCYLCSLLRDVGKLALDAYSGDYYFASVQEHLKPGMTFVEAERAALGTDHAELGAELARRWDLPERIARAIGYHHAPPPPGDDHDPLFDVVHAADTITLWAGLAVGFDGLNYTMAEHVRVGLHLKRRRIEGVMASMWDTLKTLEQSVLGDQGQEKCA